MITPRARRRRSSDALDLATKRWRCSRLTRIGGWEAKQQMVSIVVWLTPIIFGLIAYSVKSYCDSPSGSASASPASGAALALSIFLSGNDMGSSKTR
jgi:hypothetical protein